MARLRLIFGSGHTKMKWIVNSLDEIQHRWAVPPVCVRVKILGKEKDLPADLQELVGALDLDNCIGGKVLVDLCRQRSERRGSGCDVSQPCVDLPDSSSSTSRMVYKSAVQVNLFSWPNHANTDKQFEGKRREFISSWKYSNSPSLFPPQQAPLVSQERLQSVVHKVAGNNKFKGKRILLIKDQQTNEHKVVTSLTHSRQIVECRNQQDYSCKYHKKSETDVIASIDQYKDSMQSVKPAVKQEERDANLSHLQQNDVMDDAINAERVGLVASNSHTAPKRSCSYEKENSYSLTNVIKSFFVQMACIFMVIENMIKSVISRNLLNLKRVVGLATGVSVGWECCVIAISLSTNISYAFGGKHSYAYSSLNLVIYASWLRQFGRYIYI